MTANEVSDKKTSIRPKYSDHSGGIMGVLHNLIYLDPKKDPGAVDKNQLSSQAQGERIFKNTFGTVMFARKWQKAMNADKKSKIIELFTNPRDDPYDTYKPNSRMLTQVNVEMPYRKPLQEEAAEMLQEIAANYDYCVPLDIIESYKPKQFISQESQEQLGRLPTWLRYLVQMKYDMIHAKYGHHTHHFIKLLANRIDGRRNMNLDLLNDGQNEDDIQDAMEIKKRFGLNLVAEDALLEQKKKDEVFNSDLFKLKYAIWKWKLPKTLEQDWAPAGVHRAATTLRRAMLTQASPAELAMVAEDEKIQRDESNTNNFDNDDDNENEDEVYQRPAWEDMVTDKAGFKEEVAFVVDQDLKQIPPGLSKAEKEQEKRLAKKVHEKDTSEGKRNQPQKKTFWHGLKNHEFIKHRREKKERKVNLAERSLFRRYSRTWLKNCPQEQINQAKRLPHHYRFDESFHAYVVALVSSKFFKLFIMFIIVSNALILAVETGETKEDDLYSYIFEILDDLFLSVYLVEFLLKVYANPYRYWTSGFNWFDFGILIASLVKAILDWAKLADASYLKVLVIVRALRILRGISMSVQIQVLITALVETLKTHVLSVLILLFLLMYITSILAYYLFSEIPGLEEPWGDILTGMLRLFSFVTMDGWTDTTDEFEKANNIHLGRVFCLVCILLGNFLISNIFIAIIIMQISEATEAFRSRQRDEREGIITKKKEIVFRRQKLDMRQLLAKQNLSINADFYYLGSQFLRLLRHDDLVDMNDVPFSPLWMDAFYKSIHRCHHTANLLMNLHRQMADNMLEMYQINNEDHYTVQPIRRGRYNRYMKMKSRLQLLRQEFFLHSPQARYRPRPLHIRLPPEDEADILNRSRKQTYVNNSGIRPSLLPDKDKRPTKSFKESFFGLFKGNKENK